MFFLTYRARCSLCLGPVSLDIRAAHYSIAQILGFARQHFVLNTNRIFIVRARCRVSNAVYIKNRWKYFHH